MAVEEITLPRAILNAIASPIRDSVTATVSTWQGISAIRMAADWVRGGKTISFEMGSWVTVAVPTDVRFATEQSRIPGIIVDQPYKDRYKVFSEGGLLDRLVTPATMMPLPSYEFATEILERAEKWRDEEKEVTLATVANSYSSELLSSSKEFS